MTFEELWPTLAIPGEFDAMDDCDQERWRGVVKEAFLMGAKAEREACEKVCRDHAAEHWDHEGGALSCADKIADRSKS